MAHKTLRKAYNRKAYTRKSYTRKNGIKVKSAHVRKTHVPARYIKKRGLTTGKKNLIPMKDMRHLRTFGYSFSKMSSARHVALKKAIGKYGRNWTVRRLTALANVRPKLPKYEKISKKARSDVKFVKKYYPSKTYLKRHH